MKKLKKERELKETWASQGKKGSKKPRMNRGSSEAQTGFEPVNQGVADVCPYVRIAASTLVFLSPLFDDHLKPTLLCGGSQVTNQSDYSMTYA